MGYIVVKSDNIEVLCELVNKECLNGWTPIGGIAVKFDRNEDFEVEMVREYYQSMIKE